MCNFIDFNTEYSSNKQTLLFYLFPIKRKMHFKLYMVVISYLENIYCKDYSTI